MSESDRKGDIAESKAILYFMENNWLIFKPLNKDSYIDLIVKRENLLLNIQVKYLSMDNKGTLVLRDGKIDARSGKSFKYSETDVDFMVIYNPDTNKLYFYPVKDFNGRDTVTLRIEKPKNEQARGITFADTYSILNM